MKYCSDCTGGLSRGIRSLPVGPPSWIPSLQDQTEMAISDGFNGLMLNSANAIGWYQAGKEKKGSQRKTKKGRVRKGKENEKRQKTAVTVGRMTYTFLDCFHKFPILAGHLTFLKRLCSSWQHPVILSTGRFIKMISGTQEMLATTLIARLCIN